jgi:hypothetical protein
VALRLPWVAPASHHAANRTRRDRVQAICEHLSSLDAQARQRWFGHAWQQYNDLRAKGILEDREVLQRFRTAQPELFGDDFYAMGNRVNFWTCLDERDSAQVIERALTTDYEGSHTLFVNDDRNWTGLPSRTLVELFYPDVMELKTPLEGSATLVSIDRAQSLLGFQVEYSFGV